MRAANSKTDAATPPSLAPDVGPGALGPQGQAEEELRSAAWPELRGVGCSVEGGQLVLLGQVSTFHLKQVAQTLVRQAIGPSDLVIDNRICVCRTPGAERD